MVVISLEFLAETSRRQFLVTLCARPQKPPKLPELTDDNFNSKPNENDLDTPCSIKHLQNRNSTLAGLILSERNLLIITTRLTPGRLQTRSSTWNWRYQEITDFNRNITTTAALIAAVVFWRSEISVRAAFLHLPGASCYTFRPWC